MESTDNYVFLLGAGFARAISPSMPLLQDLAERVAQRPAGAARVPQAVADMMADNFAHALSYLEQAKPWVTEADNLRHRALFLEFTHAIARDLDGTVAEAARSTSIQQIPWLRQLIQCWHEHRSTVITLNYDTLIETVASGVEVSGAPGILAHHMYPAVLSDAGLRSGLAPRVEPLESFQLLKLHGSTNWYYSGRTLAFGEPIYFVPPLALQAIDDNARQLHEQRLRAVADKYPFMVPPIYDKSPLLTHETIRALWFSAGEALKHASHLVCMGYSLPQSDLTMRHFLRTACPANIKLVVVDESSAAAENLIALLRSTRIQVERGPTGKDCIPRFISEVMGKRP